MSFFFNKVTSYFTLFSVKGNICSLGADAKFWQCIPLADFMPGPVEQVTKTGLPLCSRSGSTTVYLPCNFRDNLPTCSSWRWKIASLAAQKDHRQSHRYYYHFRFNSWTVPCWTSIYLSPWIGNESPVQHSFIKRKFLCLKWSIFQLASFRIFSFLSALKLMIYQLVRRTQFLACFTW